MLFSSNRKIGGMNVFRNEDEMLFSVHNWIKSYGCITKIEEPIMGKIPDVLGVADGKIKIAVELKLHNWQRALYQAIIYKSFAEESYVAMPEEKSTLLFKNRAEFIKWGIGALIVKKDGSVNILYPSYNVLTVEGEGSEEE